MWIDCKFLLVLCVSSMTYHSHACISIFSCSNTENSVFGYDMLKCYDKNRATNLCKYVRQNCVSSSLLCTKMCILSNHLSSSTDMFSLLLGLNWPQICYCSLASSWNVPSEKTADYLHFFPPEIFIFVVNNATCASMLLHGLVNRSVAMWSVTTFKFIFEARMKKCLSKGRRRMKLFPATRCWWCFGSVSFSFVLWFRVHESLFPLLKLVNSFHGCLVT